MDATISPAGGYLHLALDSHRTYASGRPARTLHSVTEMAVSTIPAPGGRWKVMKLVAIGLPKRSDWLAALAAVAMLSSACGAGGTPSEGRTTTPPPASQPLPVAGSPAPYTAATCEPSGSRLVLGD